MTHDPAYRRLFSKPRMVEDLLRGFVPQAWVSDLDFGTLEKLNTRFVAKTLTWRDSDLLWRVRFRDDWLYVLLLIEFQSSIDQYMVIRLWVYLGLLYQDLVDQKQFTASGKLPPVLPMVIYNGEPPWQAPQQLSEVIETLPGLAPYQPQFAYLLLDEGRLGETAQQLPGNLVAALFRLEHSREPEDILALLGTLIEWLRDSREYAELNEVFLAWLKPMLVRSRFPEQQLQAIDDLYEVKTMLEKRLQAWTREWEQRSFQHGIERGELRAERRTLKKLLVQRFGELPAQIEQQIDIAEQAQLEQWLSQFLEATSLTALFPNS